MLKLKESEVYLKFFSLFLCLLLKIHLFYQKINVPQILADKVKHIEKKLKWQEEKEFKKHRGRKNRMHSVDI